jgi:tRNA threonylcarbamoyladenosine biosynthesis protein TsaB
LPVPPFISETPDRLALVIDTATPGGGLALHHNGLLEERRWGSGLKAGSRLVPDLDAMLKAQGLVPAQLELIILANGPGSFTGLRVGLATAKGLAFRHGIPLVPLDTLEILARQAPLLAGEVMPVMPARKGELYTALYRRQDFFCQRLTDFRCVTEEQFLVSVPSGCLVLGPAVAGLRTLARSAPQGVFLADEPCNSLSLDWLNRLGQDRFRLKGAEDAALLEPWYLQEFTPTPGKIRL